MQIIVRRFILLLITVSFKNKTQVNIENLKCEYLTNPIGIDIQEPRFNWQLNSEQHGVNQIAYQILMASCLSKLNKEDGDIYTTVGVLHQQWSLTTPLSVKNTNKGKNYSPVD